LMKQLKQLYSGQQIVKLRETFFKSDEFLEQCSSNVIVLMIKNINHYHNHYHKPLPTETIT